MTHKRTKAATNGPAETTGMLTNHPRQLPPPFIWMTDLSILELPIPRRSWRNLPRFWYLKSWMLVMLIVINSADNTDSNGLLLSKGLHTEELVTQGNLWRGSLLFARHSFYPNDNVDKFLDYIEDEECERVYDEEGCCWWRSVCWWVMPTVACPNLNLYQWC